MEHWIAQNTTRKQAWLTLLCALAAWLYVGWILCQPDPLGARPIAQLAILAAYFGALVPMAVAIIAAAVKSHSDRVADLNAGSSPEKPAGS